MYYFCELVPSKQFTLYEDTSKSIGTSNEQKPRGQQNYLLTHLLLTIITLHVPRVGVAQPSRTSTIGCRMYLLIRTLMQTNSCRWSGYLPIKETLGSSNLFTQVYQLVFLPDNPLLPFPRTYLTKTRRRKKETGKKPPLRLVPIVLWNLNRLRTRTLVRPCSFKIETRYGSPGDFIHTLPVFFV